MLLKLYTVPILEADKYSEEMNAFLRSKKVIKIERELIQNDKEAYWCFCILYTDQDKGNYTPKGPKTDYREILEPDEFARFAKYRDIRKEISESENIPAFAIFTDLELSELSRLEKLTLESMKMIKGIGEKKAEKYGKRFITDSNVEGK